MHQGRGKAWASPADFEREEGYTLDESLIYHSANDKIVQMLNLFGLPWLVHRLPQQISNLHRTESI